MSRAAGLLVALWVAGACGGEPEPRPVLVPAQAASSGAVAEADGALATSKEPGDAGHGARLYAQYCASCHGAQGRGDGPLAATLIPRPADHSDAEFVGAISDETLYLAIERGGPAVGKSPLMTAWGAVLSRQDITDLIAHIRRISGT